MKKFWIVYGMKNEGRFEQFDNYQAAEDEAKRMTARDGNDRMILEAVGVSRQPVPAIDIVKLV